MTHLSIRRAAWGLAALVLSAAWWALPDLVGGTPPQAASAPAPPTAAGHRHSLDEIPLAVRIFFRPLPAKAPGSEKDSPELIDLGRRLYFERGISLNKTQACNDCHRLDGGRAGADDLPTSKGAKGAFGERNSPTVLNAALLDVQFWDGRAANLVEQAKGPLINPVEMAMRTDKDVVDRLRKTGDYPRRFALAFPGQRDPLTFDNLAIAVAAFERTLLTPARFDRYLQGCLDALSDAEKHALHRFMDLGCVECHASAPVGGRHLRKVGLHHPYKNTADLGRFAVTKREEDKFVFKVPMLRNVTRTGPYFHDGKVVTLAEAVRLMAWMQLDVILPPEQIDEVIMFLRTLEAEHPLSITVPGT